MMMPNIPQQGTATTVTDFLPWLLPDDRQLICLSKQDGDRTVKEIMALSDLVCSVTRERGVTEVRVVDHTLTPKVQARSLPNK